MDVFKAKPLETGPDDFKDLIEGASTKEIHRTKLPVESPGMIYRATEADK